MTSLPSTPVKDLAAIILAAGLGKRMRSKLAKVLHPVAGRPMVLSALDLAAAVAERGVAIVVGYQGPQVKALVEAYGHARPCGAAVTVVDQPDQLGTGHAVMQAKTAFAPADRGGPMTYLILNGDTPLLREETLRALVEEHRRAGATLTVLTAQVEAPTGYGRVVRAGAPGSAPQGPVVRIVEERDATDDEAAITEINVGTYVVDGGFLFRALEQLDPHNTQKEYYLTDLVALAVGEGRPVAAMRTADPREALGINSRSQLAEAEAVLRARIRQRWLEAGVTMLDPASTMIDFDVTIGRDTVLFPHVALEGRSSIGEDCQIRSFTRISDSAIGARVTVQECCVIRESSLEDNAVVGPFAHLRPGSVLRRAAKVGNFVEMKKAELGEGSKANHLTYLGDATVGRGANLGAGTITCNYDGFRKYHTVIGDEVFIGSDTQLIAPVQIGRGAVIAAGTTVTTDVPPDALAIGRAEQVTRPGWAAKRRALQAGVHPETLDVKRATKSGRVPRPASRVPKQQPSVTGRKVSTQKMKKTGKRSRG